MKHSTEYTVADIDMLLGTIHELEATVTLLRAECEAWRREYRNYECSGVTDEGGVMMEPKEVAATDAAGALRGEG